MSYGNMILARKTGLPMNMKCVVVIHKMNDDNDGIDDANDANDDEQ